MLSYMSDAKTTTSPAKTSDQAREDVGQSFWRLVAAPLLLMLGCMLLSWINGAHRRYYGGIQDLGGHDQIRPESAEYAVPVSGFFVGFVNVLGYLLLVLGLIALMTGMRLFLDLVDLWRAQRRESDAALKSALLPLGTSKGAAAASQTAAAGSQAVQQSPVIDPPEVVWSTGEQPSSQT